jgi:hypothetical protein
MVRLVSAVSLAALALLSWATRPSDPVASRPGPAPEPSPELRRAWQAFAQAVRANNRPALRRLSAACLYCPDCATNTRAEQAAFEAYQQQHPDTWYETYQGSRSFLPADAFWREDAPLIFTAHTQARLLSPDKLCFAHNDHNKDLLIAPCLLDSAQAAAAQLVEVLVLDIDPSASTQGLQKSFNFVKTARGYQFCGYYTIP